MIRNWVFGFNPIFLFFLKSGLRTRNRRLKNRDECFVEKGIFNVWWASCGIQRDFRSKPPLFGTIVKEAPESSPHQIRTFLPV